MTNSHVLMLRVSLHPGHIRINASKTIGRDRNTGKVRIRTSDIYRHAKAIVGEAAHMQWSPWAPLEGAIYVSMTFYWPKLRADGLPLGDVDASVKGSMDALTDAGVFHDDGQVTALDVRKVYDPVSPRIEIHAREL